MPHIIADRFEPQAAMPIEVEGYEFLFSSFSSIDGDGVIGVRSPRAVFLLRKMARKDGAILKADKTTRPPFLSEIKRSMSLFAALCGSKIISRNYEDDPREDSYKIDNVSSGFSGNVSSDFFDADFFIRNHDFAKPLWVEIGFGSGRHILQNAIVEKDKLHLGIEIHRPSAEQLIRRAKRENASNIAVVIADARSFISALRTNSCERIFVHFPVPWEGSADRQVFSADFVKRSLRVLKQFGKIELRTDSKIYFTRSLEISQQIACEISQKISQKTANIDIETHENTDAVISSKYEDRWRKMNRDIFDLIITKHYDENAQEKSFDFTFKNSDLDKLREKLLQNSGFFVISESFLLKKLKHWRLNEKEYLVQILCGGRTNPASCYILLGLDAKYFPQNPLPTAENFAAHTALRA